MDRLVARGGQDRARGVVLDLGSQQAERAEEAGRGRDDYAMDAEQSREGGGMYWAGAAECHQVEHVGSRPRSTDTDLIARTMFAFAMMWIPWAASCRDSPAGTATIVEWPPPPARGRRGCSRQPASPD